MQRFVGSVRSPRSWARYRRLSEGTANISAVIAASVPIAADETSPRAEDLRFEL